MGNDSISLASLLYRLYDVKGNVVGTFTGTVGQVLKTFYGWSSLPVNYKMPSVADGVYRLYLEYMVTGETVSRPVNILNTAAQYIVFTVSNGTATLTAGDPATLTDFSAPAITLVSQTGKSFTDITGAQNVNIAADTGSVIYYTTDGSTPTVSSTAYSAPFAISSSQTVKAIAVRFKENSSASSDLVAMPTLADLLAHGVNSKKYTIGNLVSNQAQGTIDSKYYVFATDVNGNWIRLEANSANSAKFAAIDVLESGTLAGTYSNSTVNPTLSLGDLIPTASTAITTFEPLTYNLADKYNAKPNEVNYVTGYYNAGKLRGYSPSASQQGQAIDLDLSWVPSATLIEGAQYSVKVVSQLKAAWDAENGAPAKKVKASDDYAFRNYTDYVVFVPSTPTSVSNVAADGISIVATRGLITVTGAQNVKIYNMSGAIVSTAHEATVPAGFYTVVADGHAKKVLVR
jgi:hypothetical protein